MAFVQPTGEVLDAADAPEGFDQVGPLGDILSVFPAGRTAVSSMNAKVMNEGVLDQSIRSLVAAATARTYSDNVQLERHLSSFASARGLRVDQARSMLDEPGWPQFDAAEQAMLRYTTKAATEAFKMVPGDVTALADQGWTERETVEALTVVCVAAYMSVANLAMGITAGSN